MKIQEIEQKLDNLSLNDLLALDQQLLTLSQLREIDENRKDPVRFITQYCLTSGDITRSLSDQKPQLIPDLPFVRRAVDQWMKRGEQTLCKKSVQCMVTWINTALHLWEMIHFDNINNAYFSIGQDEASLVRLRMEFIAENLPDWYMPTVGKEIDTSSTKKIEFRATNPDESTLNLMLFKHSSGKGGRSVTFNRITLDELAFMDNGEEVWGANKPRCQFLNAFSSPPIRKSGFFFKLWSQPDVYGVDVDNLFEIHYTDFPDRNPNNPDPELAEKGRKWVETARRGMSEEKWSREYEGNFVSEGGLVYAKFKREHHVQSDIELSPDWEYFNGIDFGFKHPFCSLIMARERLGSYTRWYVISEHYKTQLLLREHAEHINKQRDIYINERQKLRVRNKLVDTISDSAGAQERRELRDYGIESRPSRKHKGSVMAKIDGVRTALEMLPDGKPALIISSKCPKTIMEFENYSFPKDIDDGAHEIAPEKKFDHALDVIADMFYTISAQDLDYATEMTW